MGEGEMLPGMADQPGAATPQPVAADGSRPEATTRRRPDDVLDRRIDTPPEIAGGGIWTGRRIEQEIFFADALGRPIGLLAARALVCEALHDLAHPVCEALGPLDALPALGTLVDFAHTGDLPDPTAVSDAYAALGRQQVDPLRFAARLIALDAFLDDLPRTPHAWVTAAGRVGSWVALEGSEGDLAERLGVPAHGREAFVHRVLGLTGLGGLTLADVRAHRVAEAVRAADAASRLEEVDVERAHADPRARDVWACRGLAAARTAYGPGYAAYVRSPDLAFSCTFEDSHRGPVESVASVCFGIGMRDGWWLDLDSTVTRLGLVGVADLDTERMWDLYDRLGWTLHPDDVGDLHLFAPAGWVGPVPSVAAARAELRRQREL